MSSVQGEKKCPKCGGVMIYEFDCHTSEEDRCCLRCGFTQQWFLLRNEDGTVKQDERGMWLGDYSETVGYGAVYILAKNGCGYSYALKEPLTEGEQQELIENYQKGKIDKRSYAVTYDPESGRLTAVIGEVPMSYDEAGEAFLKEMDATADHRVP